MNHPRDNKKYFKKIDDTSGFTEIDTNPRVIAEILKIVKIIQSDLEEIKKIIGAS
jgi:hypothetical protein